MVATYKKNQKHYTTRYNILDKLMLIEYKKNKCFSREIFHILWSSGAALLQLISSQLELIVFETRLSKLNYNWRFLNLIGRFLNNVLKNVEN